MAGQFLMPHNHHLALHFWKMVFHVHCFRFLNDIVVDNAECSGVVHLHWGRRLGMAYEFEGMAGGNGFSAVDVALSLSAPSQGYSTVEEEEACRLWPEKKWLLEMVKEDVVVVPKWKLWAEDSIWKWSIGCVQRVVHIATPAMQESVFFDAGKNLIMY